MASGGGVAVAAAAGRRYICRSFVPLSSGGRRPVELCKRLDAGLELEPETRRAAGGMHRVAGNCGALRMRCTFSACLGKRNGGAAFGLFADCALEWSLWPASL